MRRLFREFSHDRQASLTALSALLMTVVVAFTAFGVDLGSMYVARRKAQGVADLAALLAATDLVNADKAAASAVTKNLTAPDTTYSLIMGLYSADRTLPPDRRFAAAAGGTINAARVEISTQTPSFFSKFLTGRSAYAVQTRATAAQTKFASFAIGSRLAKVDGGLMNQMLGALLGVRLTLSAMDYQALLDAQIDAFDWMGALATRTNATVGTYDSLLSTSVRVDDMIGAMKDVASKNNGSASAATSALTTLAQATSLVFSKVTIGSIVDPGVYNNLTVGIGPKVGISTTVYDLVLAVAQAANGQKQVAVDLVVSLPGVLSANLQLAIGERAKGSGWLTVGPVGTSVSTSQTRLLLTLQMAGNALPVSVSVPFFVDIASGQAKLSALACSLTDVNQSSAALDVTPGVIDGWIGNVPATKMTNFTFAATPSAATLVALPLLTVKGRAHLAMTNMSATPVTFSYSDVQQRTKKTVGTTDLTSSLLAGLLGNTSLSVSGIGAGLGTTLVTDPVSAALNASAAPADQLLTSLLDILGVGVGEADVWVTGLRCDGAVLVN